jgi:hypothetical protein
MQQAFSCTQNYATRQDSSRNDQPNVEVDGRHVAARYASTIISLAPKALEPLVTSGDNRMTAETLRPKWQYLSNEHT